jgi:hypothetical protein
MNQAPSGSDRRRRRGLLFTLTPIVATVLIVVAMAAVVVHNLHKSDGEARPAALGSSITGSATPLTTTQSTTTPPPTPTTTPDNPALAPSAVKAVDSLHVSGVQYGIGILDRRSGQETLGQKGATGFYSASVVKLFVVVALLHNSEQGKVTLTSNDQYDIRRALELSDDTAMNAMWVNHNGPALVTEMIGLAGLQDTVLDTADPGEWGETKISARDVISVWNYAITKLSSADSKLVLGDTHNAQDYGADHFYQAFGLLQSPRPTTVKAKQGWMIAGSVMILNTTGALGTDNDYLVAILTKQSASIGYSNGRANVNRASTLVKKLLGPGLS